MNFIDTHTHLFLEEFDNDIKQVIIRALNNNINRFILPNVNISTVEKMMRLVSKFPENCFPLIGIHPSSIKENYEKDMLVVENNLKKHKFYGIGEIGIDLYWDKTFLEYQKEAFIYQIKLAKKHNLPIVIHTRKAFNEVFKIIDQYNDNDLKGIFHCFGGNITQANKIIDYKGFKLGIGGVVTFKNTNLRKVLKKVDLQHIVLETDAPFLTPSPMRGQRNESAYILNIAKEIAEVKNISLNEVASITTTNAEEIFFAEKPI